jgi:hypothetical protein
VAAVVSQVSAIRLHSTLKALNLVSLQTSRAQRSY